MANPLELLRYLDESHRTVAKSELRLTQLEEELAETRAVVRDLVAFANNQIGATPATRKDTPSPASPAPAPAAVPVPLDEFSAEELVPAAPAASVSSIEGARMSKMIRLLAMKRPELAAKLQTLKGCPAHAIVSLSCGACQQSALATLMPGGAGELAEMMAMMRGL